MTRSELTATIAKRFPTLKIEDVEVSVAEILGAITGTLAQGDRAEIRGFGSFSLNYRPPRTGRNPKTGDKVAVPEKWSPHFKAGLELRQRVDTLADSDQNKLETR
jgi:integration host factor subunit beta